MRFPPTLRLRFRSSTLLPLIALSCAALLSAGCHRDAATDTATTPIPAKPAMQAPTVVDEHSYAEPNKVAITELALDLKVDFDTKTIAGVATYTLDWKDKTATQLVLDSRDLTIAGVEGEGAGNQWQPLKYAQAPADAVLGSKFTIETPDRNAHVRVTYTTSPQASGLQWLDASMTEGKTLPFMFSQSQQIHARSWVPLQDTPSVRYSYTAHVATRPDLMALMSADNDPAAPRDGDYSFRMPQKIPSYLMAIAVGDLVFKPISARSGVWAEPTMVDKAAKEFEDTEKMIQTAEQLYGPYRWERYDLLVLPPSFPYGGMENPRLTFATPTVIVGDKSLVSLVAHELAHSWSGNLVTFSSAKDAWLNEGVTSYVENRIVEALYGKDQADMESVIARNELKEEFKATDPKLQVLAEKPGDLKDPDNSTTSTVYTKGAWFLQWMEQSVGRAQFDAFLKGYFDHFAFQSISSQQFADYAKANLLQKYPDKIKQADFDEWLYQPGVPAFAPKVLAARFGIVDSARIAWLGSAQLPPASITEGWITQEWVHFIEGLPPTLKVEQLAQLDGAYHFTGTPNGEIAQRWYPLAVRSGYTQANDAISAFLERVGRRKLVVPTYEELVKTEPGLALAKQIFAKAEPGYHPITTGTVKQLIDTAKPVATAATPAALTPVTEAPKPDDGKQPMSDGDATRPAPSKPASPPSN